MRVTAVPCMGAGPWRLNEYAGWDFWVYGGVRLLRAEGGGLGGA